MSVLAAAQAVARAALPGVPVSALVSQSPRRFVRVSRSGGSRDRILDRPMILVECFASTTSGAPDSVQAEADATMLADAFTGAASGGPWAGLWISGWDMGGLTDFAHPDYPRHSRWQFTGTLYLINP